MNDLEIVSKPSSIRCWCSRLKFKSGSGQDGPYTDRALDDGRAARPPGAITRTSSASPCTGDTVMAGYEQALGAVPFEAAVPHGCTTLRWISRDSSKYAPAGRPQHLHIAEQP